MSEHGANPRPSHHDIENSVIPDPYNFDSCDMQDQQTSAASTGLCALRQPHQLAFFQPTIPSPPDRGSLYGSQNPSLGSYENLPWGREQTWKNPTSASDATQQGLWMFGATGYAANATVTSSSTRQEHGVPATASFPMVDCLPRSAQFQQHTPSSETFAEHGFDGPILFPARQPHSGPSIHSASIGPNEEHENSDGYVAMKDQASNSEERTSDTPYAKLIERALLEAKGNRLVVKDIYKWIEANTNKASDPSSKGWQNSVRHNLSMNGAFTKIPLSPLGNKSQKGYMWALEPSAKKHGIQSTTRYRRKDETGRTDRNSAVSNHRVRSGRKGGRAAQKFARLWRSSLAAVDSQPPQHIKDEISSSSGSPNPELRQYQDSTLPVSIPTGCYQQLQPPQLVMYESSTYSESPSLGSPVYADSASPPSVSTGYYQPYLPSPPRQISSTVGDTYTYPDPYTCMPLQAAMQASPTSQTNAIPLILPPSISELADHTRGDYSTSYL